MNTNTVAELTNHEQHADSMDVFGFWLYLMTDCVLFASLFAVYVVLHHVGAYGPSLKPFIDLGYVLIETFMLLGSNLTFGLAMLFAYRKKPKVVQTLLVATFLLGAIFVGMEVTEFHHLAHAGYSWRTSGAASAFFVLVGTHGLHVTFGLLWIALTCIQIPFMRLGRTMSRRLIYLGLFWNFLDVVWIFVYSIVYLMGAI